MLVNIHFRPPHQQAVDHRDGLLAGLLLHVGTVWCQVRQQARHSAIRTKTKTFFIEMINKAGNLRRGMAEIEPTPSKS